MATAIDTAIATGAESPGEGPVKRGHSHVKGIGTLNANANGNGKTTTPQTTEILRTYAKKKYRHVAAVHSRPRTSCLSHDSESSPSFLGFRNLMVIVLSMFSCTC